MISNFPYNFLFDHGLFKICCLTSKFLWMFWDKLKPAHCNEEPMCHKKDPAQLETKFKNKNAELKGTWLQTGSWLMFNLYYFTGSVGPPKVAFLFFKCAGSWVYSLPLPHFIYGLWDKNYQSEKAKWKPLKLSSLQWRQ